MSCRHLVVNSFYVSSQRLFRHIILIKNSKRYTMTTGKNDIEMKARLERALAYNNEMQSQLLVMREKVERLLSSVKETYAANEVLLKDGVFGKKAVGVGMKGAYLKGGTFYLRGNMFFRDIKCRTCPNNDDYKQRKMENEMFPMDLNLRARHVWSTHDKQGVILGIKEQIIDYLEQSSKRHGKKTKELNSEKLSKLLNLVPDDFRIDWDYISSSNLSYRHSAKNCEAIWNLFLHPSLNRSAWSEEENLKLLEAAKKHDFQDWQAIAKEVGQRSDFQCFVQYKNNVYQVLPETHTKWSKEDDKRLLDVIARNTVNGNINWSNVNTYFPHKAKTTLHSRYNFTLNPHIRRGAPFTPEEDLLLIAAVKEYGNKFSCIPRSLFPNRSIVQLRSHYNNVLAKRHKHHPWSLEDDIKLMDFVTENGTKWLDCEKFFNERHTRLSCRTRYLTIKKYLKKNPDGGIESLPRKNCSPKESVTMNNWKEKVEEFSERVNKAKEKSRKRTQNTIEKEKTVKKVKKKIIKKVPKVSRNNIVEKIEKPYIQRLRSNEKKYYNFFKYAYSFDINRHPCDNIKIKSEDFTMVLSVLNPQIPSFDIDSSIPSHVKQNIIESSPQLSSCNELKLLPPNWSTAMGFRALCINTADISPNSASNNATIVKTNDYVRRFRERLRFIFYSTALLSRLDPDMWGMRIPCDAPTPRIFRRNRNRSLRDKEKKDDDHENRKAVLF